MGKKNKNGKADFVCSKKSSGGKSVFASVIKRNPFEVHINKEKFKILGRTCKHDKGLPGVSRAKAVQKRKQTLGKEFLYKDKVNVFKDRRIGRDADVLTEEVQNARFLAEKMSQIKKDSRFNLNDEEVLTHRGQTLEEIERFHDNRSDDDEEEGTELDAKFTELAHFGGDNSKEDRKAVIDEMISETKRRKIESAKEKEEISQLTDKLDNNLKDLMMVVGKLNKPSSDQKTTVDDYDRALREMIFEPRGTVTDKLASEEEIARQEKERLERLENERLSRMQDESENNASKPKHRSADDLDDGYFAVSETEEPEVLSYDINGETLTAKADRINEESDIDEEDNSNSDDSEEEKEEREDNASETTMDGMKNEETESDEEDEEANDSDSDDESDSDDSLNDLKETDEEEEEDDNNRSTHNERPKLSKNSQLPKVNEIKILPYTIDFPPSYEELKSLLENHTPEDQGTLIERIIKCSHPKLEHGNKEKMEKLFAFLIQYVNDIFTDATTEDICHSFRIFDQINPHLYDLIHMNPEKGSACLLDVIHEKYTEFQRNTKAYPPLETIVLFKMVSNLYTTSDFQHKVVTPTFMVISHILSKAWVRTRQDVAMGLFLVTLVVEYTFYSRRFLPAAVNFLAGMAYLSIPKRPIETLKAPPPFVSTAPLNNLLAIAHKPTEQLEEHLTAADLVTTTLSVDFKIRALNCTLNLVKEVIDITADIIGCNYLAELVLQYLNRLNVDCYPDFVQTNYKNVLATLNSVATKPLTKLVPPEKKPKALRLFEPRIEKVYDDKRRPKLSAAKEERTKLVHKVKRATKAAVREIRKDTEFIQKIRINQQIQSDRERMEKVKRIYQEASVQQGELNEISRKKNRL